MKYILYALAVFGPIVELSAQEEAFWDKNLGVRFEYPTATYAASKSNFRFNYKGTHCEIESKDKWVGGVFVVFWSGLDARKYADWREKTLKGDGTSNYRRLSDLQVTPNRVHREGTLRYKGRDWHYVHLYMRRGSLNFELTFWVQNARWEQYSSSMRRMVTKFSGEAFPCPSCGKPLGSRSRCGNCRNNPRPGNARLAAFARAHGIQIVTDPSHLYPFKVKSGHTISGRRPSRKQVQTYEKLLLKELSKYPADALRKLHIRRIVLSTHLRNSGNPVGGILEYDSDSLHLDIACGVRTPGYQANTIHHEIFHLLDMRDDGDAHHDPKWTQLNPPGFCYTGRSDGTWRLSDVVPGFLNGYSTGRVQEDKATFYAFCMSQGEKVRIRAQKDVTVAKKLAAMKNLVRNFSKPLSKKFLANLNGLTIVPGVWRRGEVATLSTVGHRLGFMLSSRTKRSHPGRLESVFQASFA